MPGGIDTKKGPLSSSQNENSPSGVGSLFTNLRSEPLSHVDAVPISLNLNTISGLLRIAI